MSLAVNPKDSNTFASACLDHTVKVWSLGSAQANFSLEAHEKGVNYVEYYHGGDKPYLVTTGDDRLRLINSVRRDRANTSRSQAGQNLGLSF